MPEQPAARPKRLSWWQIAWRIALFVAIAALVAIAGAAALQALAVRDAAGEETFTSSLLGTLPALAGCLAATAVLAGIDRESWRSFGLRDNRGGMRFAAGAAAGLVLVSVLLALLWVSGAIRISPPTMSSGTALQMAAGWAVAFLLIGLFEEIAFRGYLFQMLFRGFGFAVAAGISSVLFGAVHLSNTTESLLGVLHAGLLGAVLCYSIARTGSLWWAIGLHTSWNWTLAFLYGATDSGVAIQGHLLLAQPDGPVWLSGGAAGPEASLWMLPVIALAALLAHRMPRAGKAA